MSLEGNYSFAGIGAAEAKDRENEHRAGVPAAGAGLTALLSAPARFTTGLRVMNQGSAAALIALAHGQTTKTISGELLAALAASTTIYRGKLQFGAVVPGTVVIVEAGALADIEDDGAGLLVDVGTTTQRGTIDYRTGAIALTWGAAATEPVTAAYSHNDWTQFANAQTTVFAAGNGNAPAGAYPETLPLGFGRVVPGTISLTDGVETFVDDGKGNMIETTGGIASVEGSIDYATGVITLTGGTGTLADPTTATYSFNPFAMLLVPGGAHSGMPLLSDAIPEMGSEVYADGIKGEASLALLGVSRDAGQSTNLVTWWAHHVEEPYRIKEENTSFPPGGASNDPRINQGF